MFPFQEAQISKNVFLRTFEKSVPEDELIWHRDAFNRKIKVIESSGWYFQFDDKLPFLLVSGDVFDVPKEVWHRVIRRNDCKNLTIQITEDRCT